MELHKLAHQTGEDDLLCRIRGGDSSALAAMFDRHRGRLEKMVRLRLDSRLQGRIDPADVLQDAFVDAARRLPEFAGNAMPLFLWLRFLTSQRLQLLHRQHFGPTRNAEREVSLYSGAVAAGRFDVAGPAVARAADNAQRGRDPGRDEAQGSRTL